MAFDTKATQLFKDITNACKDVITTQMKGGLGNWVLTDGKRIFGNIYMNSARIHFHGYLTRYTEEKMRIAGIHLVYALEIYLDVDNNRTVDTIHKYTEKYIEYQFNDFKNWCRDLRTDYIRKVAVNPAGQVSPYGFKTLDASRPKLLQYPGCPL
jgi:hypothetical protein